MKNYAKNPFAKMHERGTQDSGVVPGLPPREKVHD